MVLENLNELASFDWEKVKQQLARTLNAQTHSFCSVKNVNEQYTLHFKAYHMHLSMLNISYFNQGTSLCKDLTLLRSL